MCLMVCGPLLGQAQTDDFAKLHLLIGKWKTQRAAGTIYEEWTQKAPGELIGKSYMVAGSDTTQLETIRLFKEGAQIYYVPKTAGQNNEAEVVFTLKSVEKSKFVWENPAHDFPSRIVYNLKAENAIDAWIEGSLNGQDKRIDYLYTRVKLK